MPRDSISDMTTGTKKMATKYDATIVNVTAIASGANRNFGTPVRNTIG